MPHYLQAFSFIAPGIKFRFLEREYFQHTFAKYDHRIFFIEYIIEGGNDCDNFHGRCPCGNARG